MLGMRSAHYGTHPSRGMEAKQFGREQRDGPEIPPGVVRPHRRVFPLFAGAKHGGDSSLDGHRSRSGSLHDSRLAFHRRARLVQGGSRMLGLPSGMVTFQVDRKLLLTRLTAPLRSGETS